MKRLIILSDGLWGDFRERHNSNVQILKRALAAARSPAKPQFAIEDSVGYLASVNKPLIDESIRSLYRAISLNYSPGDELWFFGFSRGALVVRSCIEMIRNCGLLLPRHLHRLEDAWHLYRTRWGPDADNATRFRKRYAAPVSVRFLGLWETVSPSGGNFGLNDTELSGNVENACHAVAIDEARKELAPLLWHTDEERSRTEQCWFSGSHRDIGGVGRHMALADVSFHWLVQRAASLGLEIDPPVVVEALSARTGDAGVVAESMPRSHSGAGRPIGVSNHDETLHPTVEQYYLHNSEYRPGNLRRYLSRDEQIQLPL